MLTASCSLPSIASQGTRGALQGAQHASVCPYEGMYAFGAAGWHPDLGHTSRHALRGCRGLTPVSQTRGGDPSLNQQSYKLRDELCACEHHVRSCCRRQIPLPAARPQRCPGRHPAPLPERDPSTALSPPSQIIPPWHSAATTPTALAREPGRCIPSSSRLQDVGMQKGKGPSFPSLC